MKILKILCIITFVSCSVTHERESFTYTDTDSESAWINAYKYEVYYGCIKEALHNDSLRTILKDIDLFQTNADLGIVNIQNARMIGSSIVKEMPPPYIKIDYGEEDLKSKNYYSYNCLKYYASRELDSIAVIEFNKFKKEQDELYKN